MNQKAYVIGVDFGTDSVRSLVVDAHTGEEIASSVFYYRRWNNGLYSNAGLNQFRQHPLDYIEGLETSIKKAIETAGAAIAKSIRAISVDTTGSTPVAVNKSGAPLALLPSFENNPNAMFVLWKDHTAINEAMEINEKAGQFQTNYLQYVGGIYSSEWFWAKLLHIIREDEQVREACYTWVEHCDWIPYLLTGGTDVSKMKRNVCAAGHKALWSPEWNGLPPKEFFANIDPLLIPFRNRMFDDTFTSDQAAGILSGEWAERLGLSPDVVIGVGAFDCHMGAVGGQIEPYHLSKVMGTSTCDMLVAPMDEASDIIVKGICGQVPGSIIPGMMGMEAGQSAFGDAYAWFKNLLSWPLTNIAAHSSLADTPVLQKLIEETIDRIIPELTKQAQNLPLQEDAELAIDWLNGRRTPDANQLVEGAFTRLNLGTDAPKLFRALVEATCFGAKAIADRFNSQGIRIDGVIGLGGVANKSPFIMQMMSDVLNMPIHVHRSEHTCALGAAMFAATAAGMYTKVEDAMKAMGQGFAAEYFPDKERVAFYAKRYHLYKKTGYFIEEGNDFSANSRDTQMQKTTQLYE